jgi:uncharacterized membrane protein
MSTVSGEERPDTAEATGPSDDASEPNVGMLERVASAVVGGTLLGVGLGRRSRRGTLLAAVGGGLLARGVRGESRLYRRLGVDTVHVEHHGPGATQGATTVAQSVTVDGSPEELTEYWRGPDLLTQVVGHFAEVRPVDGERRHWTVEGPFGRTVSWVTRLVDDRPGEYLAWESVEDAALRNEWSVSFDPAPADRGTEVTLRVRFDPPGGRVGGAALERLGFVPKTVVNKALYRFKSLAEAGEIPTLRGNPSGRGRGDVV